MRHQTNLVILLTVFWLVNSGFFSMLTLSLGAVSVLMVVLLSGRMKIIDREAQPLHLFPNIISYWGWLAKEIVLANIDVTRRIWRGPGSISPSLVVLESKSHTDMGKVILANSISLTPGTITLEIRDEEVTVHALSEYSAGGLTSINRRVSRIET
jgi:multicomponent Na+:H+ antiporter subunit E